MNIIFSIQGGLGKSVIGTAVCKAIRRQYPNCNLIVITGYPEVFTNNYDVSMAFTHGQESYFYSKYVENQEVKIFANEPYMVTEHILGQEHVIETWCKMNGIQYNGELPTVILNEREVNYFLNKLNTDKPIMVLQTHGGANNQEVKYSWARDIPRNVILSVIEEFSSRYAICHIRREDQIAFDNTIHVSDAFKGMATLIARSEKRLFMDSFAQHTAAALGKKSTVLWVCNKPEVFGYNIHDNIKANPENARPDLRYSMFTKYNIIGVPYEFPYVSESDIFNVDAVIASLVNQQNDQIFQQG